MNNDETVPLFNLTAIEELHRDPDAHIGFVRKPENPRIDKRGRTVNFENIASVKTSQLRDKFSSIESCLSHNSYFTVNAYYAGAPYPNRLTGHPDVRRKESDLRRLNSCYADIDCGRPEKENEIPGAGLTWRQAQFQAYELMDSGIIPRASIVARSGRGVYLFYFLRDENDPAMPPPAWPEKIAKYKIINKALGATLRANGLPADQVHDAARVLRVPGSIHRTAKRRVCYSIELDSVGKPFTYTMAELGTFFKIATHSTVQKPKLGHVPISETGGIKDAVDDLPDDDERSEYSEYRKVSKPGTAPKRAIGHKALNAKRAKDLLTIHTWRGGFIKRGQQYPDGSFSYGRRNLLAMYAGFLRGARTPISTAMDAVASMASGMRPAYPSDDDDQPIDCIVQEVYKSVSQQRFSNDTLIQILHITDAVASELRLITIRSSLLSAMAKNARPAKADSIRERRDFATRFIERTGVVPSARSLAALYKVNGFKQVSQETANVDIQVIGCVDPRSKGGRPKKAV